MRQMNLATTLKRATNEKSASDHKRNDSAPVSLLPSACVTGNRNKRHGTRIVALADRHSVADHSADLVARRAARLSYVRGGATRSRRNPFRAEARGNKGCDKARRRKAGRSGQKPVPPEDPSSVTGPKQNADQRSEKSAPLNDRGLFKSFLTPSIKCPV